MRSPIFTAAALGMTLACAHAQREVSAPAASSDSSSSSPLSPAATAAAPMMQDRSWQHLQAIAPRTHMHVSADHGSSTCYFISADETTLICGRRSGGSAGRHLFVRQDVRSVKLTRYTVSTVAGLGIGAGAAAVIGFAAAGSDKCTQNPCFDFLSRGDIAAIFAAPGGVIGAAIMGPLDTFRGPTVYRR